MLDSVRAYDARRPERAKQIQELRSELTKLVSFSDESWAAAEPLFAGRELAASEHLVEAGDVVDRIYFLTGGLVRFYYLRPDGKEFNKGFSVAGQVLGSVSSLAGGAPSPFFVQALEPSECLSIRYEDALALGARHRQWEVLARRLMELLALKKERREADLLLLSATERYQSFLLECSHLAGRIPNYHVASYLGITEVALSRIRRRLGINRGS